MVLCLIWIICEISTSRDYGYLFEVLSLAQMVVVSMESLQYILQKGGVTFSGGYTKAFEGQLPLRGIRHKLGKKAHTPHETSENPEIENIRINLKEWRISYVLDLFLAPQTLLTYSTQ